MHEYTTTRKYLYTNLRIYQYTEILMHGETETVNHLNTDKREHQHAQHAHTLIHTRPNILNSSKLVHEYSSIHDNTTRY